MAPVATRFQQVTPSPQKNATPKQGYLTLDHVITAPI